MIPADELAAMRTEVGRTFDKTGTIVRRTEGVEDDHGNVTTTYVPDEDTTPLSLTHTNGREVTVDRDTQISDWFARLPTGTVISGRDRIEVDGVTYEVVGPPSDEDTHIRAQLVHVSGG